LAQLRLSIWWLLAAAVAGQQLVVVVVRAAIVQPQDLQLLAVHLTP
jgi:hypothetical protein